MGQSIGKRRGSSLGAIDDPVSAFFAGLDPQQHWNRGRAGLAKSQILKNLKELRLGHNQLGTEGVELLASSPYLTQLEILDLSENGVGPGAMKALIASAWIYNLKELLLNKNQIGDEGVKALVSRSLPLQKLDLQWNGITRVGAIALGGAVGMKQLKLLDLWGNFIEEDGVQAIKHSKTLGPVTNPVYPGEPEQN